MGATKTRLPVLLLALAAALLTLAAGLMLFSTFMVYDDEGYVLFSLKNFVEHGGLYDQVYSQYGPAPFAGYAALHALGLPLTHTGGRCVTWLVWSSTAVLSSALVWRATRHFGAALAVLAAVFVELWVMVSEPNHPGGLISLSTVALAALGGSALTQNRPGRWAFAAGAIGAALVFTKINVGVFVLISTGAFLLLHAASPGLRRVSPWLLAAGLAALPFVLMRTLLDVAWVKTYALIFACSAVPAISAARAAPGPRLDLGWRHVGFAVLGALVVSVPVLAAVFASGTTWAGLREGLVLGPLRHAGRFSLPFHWPAGALVVAFASAGAWLLALFGRHRGHASRVDSAVAIARLVVTAGLGGAMLGFPDTNPGPVVFAFSLPCLWLFLWPLDGESAAGSALRSWVGLLLLGQHLHAYPVAGSQLAWGAFLALPLAALGAVDAACWLGERTHARAGRTGRVIGRVVPFALAGFALVLGGRLAQLGSRYFDARSLAIPGAASLRLPDANTTAYRTLTLNAAAHADVLFSLPGMFSFNLWSGRPSPTLTNVTHWFSLLDLRQQQAIVDSLAAHPRAVVIVQREHVAYLREHGLAPAGPLYDYLERAFTPAFSIDGFQFHVHAGRPLAPLLMAEVRQRPPQSPEPDAFNTLLTLHVLLGPGEQVASLDIATLDRPDLPVRTLRDADVKLEVTPINLRGEALTAPAAARLPLAAGQPVRIAVYFNRGDLHFSPRHTVVILRDAGGAELALLRLLP